MQQASESGRRNAPPLLHTLLHDPWSPRALAEVLGQLHFVYRQLIVFEERHRAVWQRDLPASHLVTPLTQEILTALEACLVALDVHGPLAARPHTQALCERWGQLAGSDPVTAFAVTAIGGYWMEPAFRGAVREALWRQPCLFNGDARFCWTPGGPEGSLRRQVWHGVMALGPLAGRTARVARAARLKWYDDLLLVSQKRITRPLNPEAAVSAEGV